MLVPLRYPSGSRPETKRSAMACLRSSSFGSTPVQVALSCAQGNPSPCSGFCGGRHRGQRHPMPSPTPAFVHSLTKRLSEELVWVYLVRLLEVVLMDQPIRQVTNEKLQKP